jgi:GDPmannose 4,6-dehydratase
MGCYEKEKYVELDCGETIVEIDPKFYRPAEVHELCGDPSLAEAELGWKRKSSFYDLVSKMYENDYSLLKKQYC